MPIFVSKEYIRGRLGAFSGIDSGLTGVFVLTGVFSQTCWKSRKLNISGFCYSLKAETENINDLIPSATQLISLGNAEK